MKEMTSTQRDVIVDDLLKRFPQGPEGRLKKSNYTIEWVYSQSADVHRETPVPDCENFGYEVNDIMRAHWAMAKGDIRKYLSERWPDAGRIALKRRFNRLKDRIDPAIAKFMRDEGRGIYRVKIDWERQVYVIANSKLSAKTIASAIIVAAGEIVEVGPARKINVAMPETLSYYMEKNLLSARANIRDIESRIEKYERKLSGLRSLEICLAEMGQSQASFLMEKE